VKILAAEQEAQEEPEISLEEEIKILQEQKLPPEKIAEQIFQEDLNADITILSNMLKLDPMALGRIKGRISRIKKRREAKGAPAAPTEGKTEEEPLYKGELDTTVILRDILTHHPDIPQKVVDEVLSWADYGPIHPTALVSLLQSFRGITSTTAYVVAQKYNLALQKAQQEGKLQLPTFLGVPMPGAQTPQPGFPAGFPSTGLTLPTAGGGAPSQQPPTGYGPPFTPAPATPPSYPGWGYPPQVPSLSEEKVRNIIREELKGEQTKGTKEPEQYVEIDDPSRDNTGNVILDSQDRPIMKKIRVPVSQAGLFAPKDDAELRVLEKLEKYKKIFGPELTEDRIRAIIKDEMPPPQPTAPQEKPITVEDVKKASAEAAETTAKQVLAAKDQEDIDERRHRETLDAIRSSASAKTVEGYKEDGARLMGQGLSEVASVAREKKPMEVVARVFLGGEGSSPKEVAAGAGEGLFQRLKNRGWVVEQ